MQWNSLNSQVKYLIMNREPDWALWRSFFAVVANGESG
jgi:hypothetical protein